MDYLYSPEVPDFNYRTIFKPVFRFLPSRLGHRMILSFFGRLSVLPKGTKLIDFFAHMAPPESLAKNIGARAVRSPLGLSYCIDPEGVAFKSFERFGFGHIELGPVDPAEKSSPARFQSRFRNGKIECLSDLVPVERLLANLEKQKPNLAFLVSIESESADFSGVDALARTLRELYPDTFLGLTISARSVGAWLKKTPDKFEAWLRSWEKLAREQEILIWLKFSGTLDSQTVRQSAALIQDERLAVLLDGELSADTIVYPSGISPTTLETLKNLKTKYPHLLLGVAAGISEPQDAEAALAAGADLLWLNSGFVDAGPGLPQRIHDLLNQDAPLPKNSGMKPFSRKYSTFWACALGLSMIFGGLLALYFGLAEVILPYDQQIAGISAAEILRFNPRILDFMAHDRITLAGTMLSLGISYFFLSYFGIARGLKPAKETLLVSAVVGFVTFFSFIGYGYFDLFHAFVTLALLQITFFIFYADVPPLSEKPVPSPHNDRHWRLGVWGQFLFIVQGVGLILAGMTIMGFGMTSVFVPEDLAFLCATAEAIAKLHPNLVPLIAHDRATFGGMLISTGLLVMFSAMWVFGRGRSWLWWMFLIAGAVPYLFTIWIHLQIGYTDLFHISPVFIGLAILFFALGLSRGYLCSNRG